MHFPRLNFKSCHVAISEGPYVAVGISSTDTPERRKTSYERLAVPKQGCSQTFMRGDAGVVSAEGTSLQEGWGYILPQKIFKFSGSEMLFSASVMRYFFRFFRNQPRSSVYSRCFLVLTTIYTLATRPCDTGNKWSWFKVMTILMTNIKIFVPKEPMVVSADAWRPRK